jgi:demethylmenaquinone methyltransferase/2-methoxy-6-polyprenyl-1,4-benzoquinol methylase
MFNRIARRYDVLNRVLSLGIDIGWRKKLARFLPSGDRLELLDIATGTADQILYLLDGRIARATGVDLSTGMLEIGKKKVMRAGLNNHVRLQTGDACALPFVDESFDVTTISFGIRNVPDYKKALAEMYRVLKPGGRSIILEFSLPEKRFVRAPYLFYFRRILPGIGSAVSGDSSAYRYLNQTVETFPSGDEFLSAMRKTGFVSTAQIKLSFGIASIYIGEKTLNRAHAEHQSLH